MTKIIAGIDGSPLSLSVIDTAVWVEQKLNKTLLLLHSLERPKEILNEDLSGSIGFRSREKLLNDLTELDEQRAKIAIQHSELLLQSAREHAFNQGAKDVETLQLHGELIENLIALKNETSMILLGRSGKDNELTNKTIGSNIEHAVRALQSPILISVNEFTPPSSFMLAYDGREATRNAIGKIIASPLLKGLKCHIVMVGNPEDSTRVKQLSEAKAKLEDSGFNVKESLIEGNIYSTLLNYQKNQDVDLIVMGAYSHSKVRQFFVGSNTNRMIVESEKPLLILR